MFVDDDGVLCVDHFAEVFVECGGGESGVGGYFSVDGVESGVGEEGHFADASEVFEWGDGGDGSVEGVAESVAFEEGSVLHEDNGLGSIESAEFGGELEVDLVEG